MGLINKLTYFILKLRLESTYIKDFQSEGMEEFSKGCRGVMKKLNVYI